MPWLPDTVDFSVILIARLASTLSFIDTYRKTTLIMNKTILVLGVAGMISVLSGCATARSPVTGVWYTDTHSGVAATSNQAGNRVGEACASTILGLIGTGDASIEAARRNGGITMISSVDDHSKSILGLWAEYCTIVRGR